MDRILVVEDDEMLNAALCYNLNKQGYEIIQAYDYKSAKLRLAQNWQLFILDVNLPDGSGFELCKCVQAGVQVPVLF